MHTLDLAIIAAVFPVIFIGELPDKSMFASLVMASRGHPFLVWLGTALAFLVHVVIAVSIGVSLFKILPQEGVDVVVAILFGVGAVVAFIAAFDAEEHQAEIITEYRTHRVFATAFLVIFVAEWGDLSQLLTAGLVAQGRHPLGVFAGSWAALALISLAAVLLGRVLMRYVSLSLVQYVGAAVCALLAVVTVIGAFS